MGHNTTHTQIRSEIVDIYIQPVLFMAGSKFWCGETGLESWLTRMT